MSKQKQKFIEHILESIELIEEYLKGISEKEFWEKKQIQDSVLRRIEIIGEASKNLPSELKESLPEVPWQRITGLRNVLSHHYWGVDLKMTWNIVQKDIPDLKKQLLEYLERNS
jgi:uncharacterized protein with HEPN domain